MGRGFHVDTFLIENSLHTQSVKYVYSFILDMKSKKKMSEKAIELSSTVSFLKSRSENRIRGDNPLKILV